MRKALAITIGGLPLWALIIAGLILDPAIFLAAIALSAALVAIVWGSIAAAFKIMDN